jgi:CHASE3 domain sensor protein
MSSGIAWFLAIVALWILWEIINIVRLFRECREKAETIQAVEVIREKFSKMDNDQRLLELMEGVYFAGRNIMRLRKQVQALRLLFVILLLLVALTFYSPI